MREWSEGKNTQRHTQHTHTNSHNIGKKQCGKVFVIEFGKRFSFFIFTSFFSFIFDALRPPYRHIPGQTQFKQGQREPPARPSPMAHAWAKRCFCPFLSSPDFSRFSVCLLPFNRCQLPIACCLLPFSVTVAVAVAIWLLFLFLFLFSEPNTCCFLLCCFGSCSYAVFMLLFLSLLTYVLLLLLFWLTWAVPRAKFPLYFVSFLLAKPTYMHNRTHTATKKSKKQSLVFFLIF